MSDYDSVNAANAEAARAAGWPDLTGAPKQISWGITCRADKVRELEATDHGPARGGEDPVARGDAA